MITPRNTQVVGLDIVRFAAALLVVSFHLGFWCFVERSRALGSAHGPFGAHPYLGPTLPLAPYGWVGVPIFFAISGFVIAYTANGSSMAKYLESRVVRLLPAAWICATITAAIYLATGMFSATEVAVPYLRSLILDPFRPMIDGPYWTLRIEIEFYALISLFLMANRMKYLERAIVGVGWVTSLAWLARAVAVKALSHHGPISPDMVTHSIDAVLVDRYQNVTLLGYIGYFATGIVLWSALNRGWSIGRMVAFAFITAGCLAEIVYLSNANHNDVVHVSAGPAAAIYAFALAIIVLSIRYNSKLSGIKTREIGLATYPLYLIHNTLGTYLAGRVLAPWMPMRLASILALLVCVAAAFLVIRPGERILQKGFRAWLNRLGNLLESPLIVPLTRATVAVD